MGSARGVGGIGGGGGGTGEAQRKTHHPNSSITTTPHALASGDSASICVAKSLREEGTNTSSCSMLHVYEWWFLWLMRHEW